MKEYPGKHISHIFRKSQMFWTQYLKEYNITSAEYPVLIALYKKEGITQDDIANKLSIDKSAVTRIVKNLLDKGLIERKKDSLDRRYNRIYLTTKGQSCWKYIEEGMAQWHEISAKNITTEEIEQVISILSRMANNMENYLEHH